MMDLSAAQAGRDNITSAGDMGLFLRLLYRGQVLSPVISATIINTMQRQQIRDKLPALIPEDIVIAHKTGDLPGVEHDAGIIYIPKRPCILVVLTDNLSDNRAGACLIAKIAKSVYSHFCLAE
ncbi:MAG: serine hydrolase [Firmicutes bacterium]|nr:serine hydrolase [Bacillota bacterium]